MRITGKSTAVKLAVLSAAVAAALAFNYGTTSLSQAESEYSAAGNASLVQTASSSALVASLSGELVSSRSVVSVAANQVDDPGTLTAATAAVTDASTALQDLNRALALRAPVEAPGTAIDSILPWDYTAATERIHQIDDRISAAAGKASAALAKLTVSHTSVSEAVASHTAAINAKARAVSAAAQRAAPRPAAPIVVHVSHATASHSVAAQAVAAVPTITSPPVSLSVKDRALAAAAAQSSPYSVPVRTVFVPTIGADGVWSSGQSAIDAGGQNAIEYSNGWTDVAAHNGYDSLALQLKTGDIVNFTGAISGSYRVTGTTDVQQGSSANILGSLGTKMMMQTCHWDSDLMRVVGLVPA